MWTVGKFMIHLSELLNRFKNLGLGEKTTKEVLVAEINNLIGQNTISTKDIKIQNGTAFVRGGSALKSEIFIHKDQILKQAREKSGESFVVGEIR